jgi:hypothetical protein
MTIMRGVEYVTNEMLSNSGPETEYCPDVWHATNGANIEIC